MQLITSMADIKMMDICLIVCSATVKLFVLALCLVIFHISPSEAFEIPCPDKVLTSQKLGQQVPGWKAHIRPIENGKTSPYSYLSSISLYYDHPRKIIELKPDNDIAREPTWSFEKWTDGAAPLFMACHYIDTRIQLIKALPLNIKQCVLKRSSILECKQHSQPDE